MFYVVREFKGSSAKAESLRRVSLESSIYVDPEVIPVNLIKNILAHDIPI